MTAVNVACRVTGAIILAGAAWTATDRQWAHALFQGAMGVLLIWSTTTRADRAIDVAFLFTRRHHRSCLRTHPDMTHDRYVTEFLPFYASVLTAKREQEIE